MNDSPVINFNWPTFLSLPYATFGIGVACRIFDSYGFWWSLVCGLFWPVWYGYRITSLILRATGL